MKFSSRRQIDSTQIYKSIILRDTWLWTPCFCRNDKILARIDSLIIDYLSAENGIGQRESTRIDTQHHGNGRHTIQGAGVQLQ